MAEMPPLDIPPELPAAGGSALGAILFSLTAAAAVTAALMWSLGRVGASRGRVINLPAGFAAGATVFTLLYFLNRAVFPARPVPVIVANLLLLAVVLAVPLIRRERRRMQLRLIKGMRSAKRAAKLRAAAARQQKPAGPRRLQKPPLSKAELKQRIEIANLQNMLRLDPNSTFCHEKLSELYEKQGKLELALEAARTAAAQDPTVKNNWRVGELEEKLGLRPGPGQDL